LAGQEVERKYNPKKVGKQKSDYDAGETRTAASIWSKKIVWKNNIT